MHLPDEDKGKSAEIDNIEVVPWDLHVRSEPEARFRDADIVPQVVLQTPQPTRRMYVTISDL